MCRTVYQYLWHMQSITWLVPPSKVLFMNSSCLTSRTFAGSWMTWRRLLFSRLHTWRNRDLDSYMYKEKFIMTVFCQVIWKWHSKMIIITCKLKEHQWYTNVQNFYIQNLTCVKHASHEFIHQSYRYAWKSEEIFLPKNMYSYGQVQLNQNLITGDNWLIIIIFFCTLVQRWKQI